jgi:hypothetical protein
VDGRVVSAAVAPIEHEHVFDDRWYPLDRTHVRRVCVIPGCGKREVKEVKS